jgi:chemotaxis protein MotB
MFQQTVTAHGPTAADAEAVAFTDPWAALDGGRERRDNWLLSYIDILTLFLTLFVVLLALQPKNESPPVDAAPGDVRVVSPEPIERLTAPPTPSVQARPPHDSESSDTPPELPAMTDITFVNESASDAVQPVSIMALQVEPVAPLIYLPATEVQNQTIAKPPSDVAESGDEPAADRIDTRQQEEPAAGMQPVPTNTSRELVRHLMTKLAQQNLEERVRISEVAEGVYLEMSDTILFALGSAELKRDGAALLDELAQLLIEHTGIVSVEGHTDDRPIETSRFPSNWELSSGRATTVTRYLIGKGLDRDRLRAVGYADTRPLESNATPEGRKRNRRVALIVEIPEL